jgi:hypothetical protein
MMNGEGVIPDFSLKVCFIDHVEFNETGLRIDEWKQQRSKR